MTLYSKLPCPVCEGEGTVEATATCFRPMSDCCGGCTTQERCDRCDGEGTIDTTETQQALLKLADLDECALAGMDEDECFAELQRRLRAAMVFYAEQTGVSL